MSDKWAAIDQAETLDQLVYLCGFDHILLIHGHLIALPN